MGKSRKSTIRKFEFYETITDNGIKIETSHISVSLHISSVGLITREFIVA